MRNIISTFTEADNELSSRGYQCIYWDDLVEIWEPNHSSSVNWPDYTRYNNSSFIDWVRTMKHQKRLYGMKNHNK